MHVRRATEEDRTPWCELRRALEPERARASHDAEITQILRQRFHRAAFVCVEEDGSVTAFAEASRGLTPGPESGTTGCLDRMGVSGGAPEPAAGALLAAVETWMRDHRCAALTSAVADDDTQGQALRQRLGFHPSRRLVLYSKPLHVPAAGTEADHSEEPPDAAVEDAGTEPALTVGPVHASGRTLRAAGHGLAFALGGCALLYTDIWSAHPLYGGALPIVDALFVLYVLVLVTSTLYRRRTARRDPGYLLENDAIAGMTAPEAHASPGAAPPGCADAGSNGERGPKRSRASLEAGSYSSGRTRRLDSPDFAAVDSAGPPSIDRVQRP